MTTLRTPEQLARHQDFLVRRFGLDMHRTTPPSTGRRHVVTPLGPVREYRYCVGDSVVAYHRFVPVALRDGDRTIAGLQSSNSWVAEAHRGFGLLPTLIGTGLQELAQEGFRFFLAFPNQRSFAVLRDNCGIPHVGTCRYLVKPAQVVGIAARLGWRIPAPLLAALQGGVRVADRVMAPGLADGYRADRVEAIPQDIESLIAAHAIPVSRYLQRDHAQLQWRYADAAYHKYACYHRGRLSGFLVARSHVKEGLDVAAMLEMFADRSLDRRAILQALLQAFESDYRAAHIYSALMHPHDPDRHLMYRRGYMALPTGRLGRSFWFLFKSLDQTLAAPTDFSRWHVRFYDSIDSF